jgi:hypothetical protein
MKKIIQIIFLSSGHINRSGSVPGIDYRPKDI